MSAWIVSNQHIALLVEAIYRHEVPLENPLGPDELGQLLWDENYKSVNYRYDNNETAPTYIHQSEGVRDLAKSAAYVYKLLDRIDTMLVR